jgi:transcriptional regulator with XRE-family HTH domain
MYVELAQKLKRLRQEAGLSTRDLARRTGFSQSKISKVENGLRVTSAVDVRSILAALDVDPEIRRGLLREARRAEQNRFSTTQVGRITDLSEFTELEAAAREVVIVGHEYVPLWFQTEAYTRLMFQVFRHAGKFSEYMTNKEHRKELSLSGRRRNLCVVDEAVLSRPLLPRRQWSEQLDFFERRMSMPGVELGIRPHDASSDLRLESWWGLDEKSVLVELPGTPNVLVTEKTRVRSRFEDLDALMKLAVWGGEAIELIRSQRRQLEVEN